MNGPSENHPADRSSAAEELLPLVYEQLRALAASHFRHQRGDHTLQPTALVHEAYLKLVRGGSKWNDQQHFFALAATAMRHILLNHATARRAAKRAGNRVNVTLQAIAGGAEHGVDLVALDAALTKLAGHDERLGRLVELRFFAGLTMEQIATELGVSRRTVQTDWRYVRAWLAHELGIEKPDE